jgi:hypothetical protein
MLGPRRAHGLQGFGADKGRIAIKDDDIARLTGQQGGRLRHGMGRAQLRLLQHHLGCLVKGAG